MICGVQCDEVLVVMHFDEEREVTETECGIVNTTTCNQETVVRPEQVSCDWWSRRHGAQL